MLKRSAKNMKKSHYIFAGVAIAVLFVTLTVSISISERQKRVVTQELEAVRLAQLRKDGDFEPDERPTIATSGLYIHLPTDELMDSEPYSDKEGLLGRDRDKIVTDLERIGRSQMELQIDFAE